MNCGPVVVYEPRGECYSSQCVSTFTRSGGVFIVRDGSTMKGLQCFIVQRARMLRSIYCKHTLKTVMALSVRMQPIANKTTRPSIHDFSGSGVATAAG